MTRRRAWGRFVAPSWWWMALYALAAPLNLYQAFHGHGDPLAGVLAGGIIGVAFMEAGRMAERRLERERARLAAAKRNGRFEALVAEADKRRK